MEQDGFTLVTHENVNAKKKKRGINALGDVMEGITEEDAKVAQQKQLEKHRKRLMKRMGDDY